jgi:hypothetical protein
MAFNIFNKENYNKIKFENIEDFEEFEIFEDKTKRNYVIIREKNKNPTIKHVVLTFKNTKLGKYYLIFIF